MTLDYSQIRGYFASPARSYWRWQDAGFVVAWKDELTIAFREELQAVLNRLAPAGLPPLGSVLLLLAACRDNWEEPPDRRTLLHTHLGLLYGGGYADLLTEVLTGLGKVYRIREQVRGTGRKAALAAALFEDAPGRHSPDKSVALAERFRLGLAEDEQQWKPESALDDLLHDLGCLRWGLGRFDFDKLDLRLQTGLDDVPGPAPVEPPPPTSARDLIAALQDDPELGAVARLAHLLLAAVQLPRALSDPDELPIGGVSDIANRGSLDRLLLSELASDDLTLAVRVAMNEALYLRRESPPRTPPRQRRLLLDAGLRTWGVPRVFIAAVGLAVAATTDEKIHVESFRAAGSEAIAVDLHSAAGLKIHLRALDHRLHPAAAVAALGRTAVAEAGDVESDLIVVTTDDTLADADFQRQLREAAPGGLYLASVGRDGRFELTHRGLRGSKLVCRAKFDLDEVLRPRPDSVKLLDPNRDVDVPAFFREAEPPLRFSCPVDAARSWLVHPQTVISYTRDGRLLLWDDADRGARQLASGLKADGNLLWCDSAWDHEGRLRLVIGKRSRRGLVAVTVNRTGHVHSVPLQLTGEQPQEILGLAGAVLVLHANQIEALSWQDGRHLASRNKLKVFERRGRFFKDQEVRVDSDRAAGTAWYALAYHAGRGELSIQAELVYREPAGNPERLIGVADCVGVEGPIGLTIYGQVIDLATGMERRTFRRQCVPGTTSPFSLMGVSRDGQRFLVQPTLDSPRLATRGPHLLLDASSGAASVAAAGGELGALEQPMSTVARPRVTHARFRAIGVSDGALTLVSRRGQNWPILHNVAQRELRFPWQRSTIHQVPLEKLQQFRAVESWTGGFTIDRAQWPDGSVAWLDGRGLLHLRSSDPECSEATLALCDGPMGGWLANGETFGAAYWLDRSPSIGVGDVHLHVLKRFVRSLA